MVRINLLPPEVLEKRRWEKWYPYVFFAFAILAAILVLVYAYLMLSGGAKNAELQSLKEESQALQTQADAFGIFEQKEQQLAARSTVAQKALASRLQVGRIAEEVSLVLPDEVWVDSMVIGETAGLRVRGQTPRSPSQSMDVGYKSVAKTLVRLNELPDIYDVWLVNALNNIYQRPATETTGEAPLPEDVVAFESTGKIAAPNPPAANAVPAVPAPPSTGQ